MSSSSYPAPQPNRAALPAASGRSTKRLVALLWASAAFALLLAVAAPLGFAPMPSWGRAGVKLDLTSDGKTVLAAAVHSAGEAGPDSSGALVGADPAKRTITLEGNRGILTTYPLARSATLTLDGDAITLDKLPISVWAAEFTANKTALVIRSVSIVSIFVAACCGFAALLAMRKPTTRSVTWIRHLLVGGYVLFGLYLFAGVRIINLIQEKGLMVQLGDSTTAAAPAPVAPPPTTAPTTQKAGPTPSTPAAAPRSAEPSRRPSPSGSAVPTPTMRTGEIDLDTPATKPAVPDAPVTPAPKPAPTVTGLAPATQPSAPVQSATAATQPTTQAAASASGPPKSSADAATEEPPEPEFLMNQYLLYLRTPWNRVGGLLVFVFIALVILAHLAAWDLARATALNAASGHANIGGQDTAYHSNMDSSLIIHVVVILLIPLLLQLHFPNRLPRGRLDFSMAGGGGSSEPVQVKIVKKKPHKKVKKYVFRRNSAVSFYVPKMDDSRQVELVDNATQEQYTVTQGGGGTGSGHGRGRGHGHGSGWGNGTGKVRFYHLQYSGANTDWNDGFSDGKDANLLTEWENRERKEGSDLPFGGVVVLTAAQLRPDTHGYLPAFIFLTGNVNAMSQHETDQIRQYILKGGMIFADPQYAWQNGFTEWCRRLFPDERMIPLDNSEDDIFTSRYTFTVPPQFWSGSRSYLGLKHGDRWVIICDRGRMSDGWKSPINDDCVKMGINIIDYANAHMMTKQ